VRVSAASLPGIIGLTLLATVAGQAKQADAVSDVTICLHNSIVATPGAVERAKMVAKRMFAAIGVNISWASAVEPPNGLLVDVVLATGDSGEDESGPLAEAFPFAGPTGHIMVRYDRVHNAAGVSHDLEPLILAHVLVHEITHVLQCLDRHSDTGVMKAHWTPEDYYDMRWKPLTFAPEDIELIRLGMQVLRSRTENHMGYGQ
jgi:hypothetical protein